MDDLREKYNVITDLWKFIKETADVQDTDEYMDYVVSKSSEIVKAHPEQDEFARCMVCGYTDYVDRRLRACQE